MKSAIEPIDFNSQTSGDWQFGHHSGDRPEVELGPDLACIGQLRLSGALHVTRCQRQPANDAKPRPAPILREPRNNCESGDDESQSVRQNRNPMSGLAPALRATDEREYRTAARRPRFSALSNAKMERAGITPMPPLPNAIRQYLDARGNS